MAVLSGRIDVVKAVIKWGVLCDAATFAAAIQSGQFGYRSDAA